MTLPMQHPSDSQTAAQEGLVALDMISQLLTTSAFDLDRLLTEIVRTTAKRMRVKASALRMLHEETGELALTAVYGLSPTFLSEGPVFDTQSRFQQLIENGGVLEILDVSREPDLRFSQAVLAEGIASLLAVGLYQDDKIIGALSVYTDAPQHFSDPAVRTLRVIANQASVAVQLARLHQAEMEKDQLEWELTLAGEIQAGVLPKQMPAFGGMRIAGWSEPWQQVGGDFYDFIELPEGNLGIVIGDVSGKGIPAALLMFTVRMAVRAHVEHEYALREIMRRVSRALYRDTQPEQFATLFYGVLNLPNRVFTYVNASHNPPLIFRGDQVLSLEVGGLPVGLLPDLRYEEAAVQLLPGDLLVFYTDGYTDIAGENNEFFGEERLRRCLQQHRHEDPEQIIQALEKVATTFISTSDHGDDRTMVVIKVD